jgi:hypothetical protein
MVRGKTRTPKTRHDFRHASFRDAPVSPLTRTFVKNRVIVDPVAFGSAVSRSVRLGRGCHSRRRWTTCVAVDPYGSSFRRYFIAGSRPLVLTRGGVGLARSWSARVVSVIGHVGMRVKGSHQ